jgi:hypothetical protein
MVFSLNVILIQYWCNMSESDISDDGVVEKTSKKRKGIGRLRDVLKKMRVQSHEPGADCKCKMKCFEKIPLEVRDNILPNLI